MINDISMIKYWMMCCVICPIYLNIFRLFGSIVCMLSFGCFHETKWCEYINFIQFFVGKFQSNIRSKPWPGFLCWWNWKLEIVWINSVQFSSIFCWRQNRDFFSFSHTLINKPAAQAADADPSQHNAAPPIGKIHPFSQITVTFKPIQRFYCPSRFIISEKMSI